MFDTPVSRWFRRSNSIDKLCSGSGAPKAVTFEDETMTIKRTTTSFEKNSRNSFIVFVISGSDGFKVSGLEQPETMK